MMRRLGIPSITNVIVYGQEIVVLEWSTSKELYPCCRSTPTRFFGRILNAYSHLHTWIYVLSPGHRKTPLASFSHRPDIWSYFCCFRPGTGVRWCWRISDWFCFSQHFGYHPTHISRTRYGREPLFNVHTTQWEIQIWSTAPMYNSVLTLAYSVLLSLNHTLSVSTYNHSLFKIT